jgi:hypothetical protein
MNLHPNVHSPWHKWSNEETLHVAVAYSNPYRWDTRRELMNDFRHHFQHMPNVALHIGELAYGDRPHEVTGQHESDVQLRTHSELFHKENILNRVIQTFPDNWKYGCYIDADFSFTRHDWALETIHQLQHHEWVQPFSTYASLSSKTYGGSQPGRIARGFAATYVDNGHRLPESINHGGWGAVVTYGDLKAGWVPVGATGGAWAFRRSSFEAVGGLMDQAILGHADWFMAFGLVSQKTRGIISESKYHPHYVAMIREWQERAKSCRANIGYVDQFAVHHFHGAIKNRGYETRDQILVKYQFDPVADLRKNYHGVHELVGNKPGLRDAIRRYFLSRDEDNPTS